MKKEVYIAGLMFVFMGLINLTGGLVNTKLNYSGNIKDVPDSLIFVLIFCAFYLATSAVRIRLSNSLKLPLMRILFWTLLICIDLVKTPANIDGSMSEILFLTNSGINLFWNTIFLLLTGKVELGFFVGDIGINIILFGLYEFIIIKISTKLINKFFKRRTAGNIWFGIIGA